MTSESLHGPYDHHGCATEATVAFRVTNICTLDHRHRLAELRSGNAAPVHYGYDSENRHSVVSNTAFRATYAYTSDGRTNGLSVSRTRLTGLSNALRACVETEADGATTRVTTSFDPVAKVSTDTLERTGMATTRRKRMFGREIEATDADGVTRYNYFDPYGRVYLTREFTGERFHWRTLAMRNDVGDVYASARFIGGTPHWNNVARFNGFDSRGNLVASTNEMGYVTHSLFDSAGRLAVRFGAVHPVGYGYDATGRLKSLFTTRSGATWDVTQWNYDPATGLATNKVYADGSVLAHGWTSDGLPERTTWARGAWRHVAYNDRRLPAAVSYSDPGTPGHELSYDAFGRLVAVADAAGRRHGYAYGASTASPTNETAAADAATNAIARILDANGRPVSATLRVNGAPRGGVWHAYADSGRLAQVAATNAQGRGLVAAYTNFSGRSFGHSVELPSGAVFTRTLARDAYRPNRVTSIVHAFDGVEVSRYAHTFDALDRLAARNADAFGYNARSEVVSATVASNEYAYAYDHIGNHTTSSVNSATTAYTANALNQYTSLSNLVQSCNPVHDLDGNLLANGVWSYTWDCENRLVTASSNNVCVVSNAYDYLSRRVLKATPEAVHAFVYDGWNLIHETVTAGNGDVSEIQYFWGPDLSGTLQGAGGIGGLLAVSINGQFYLPCVDNNGNITAYIDEQGVAVAEYTYDAFGGTIEKSGAMADAFAHRFSTKYYDAEIGLYYYGYRFYSTALHRWLNRDPLGEDGGINLYAFCGNDGVNLWDVLGEKSWENGDPLNISMRGAKAGVGFDGSGIIDHRADKSFASRDIESVKRYIIDYFDRNNDNKLDKRDCIPFKLNVTGYSWGAWSLLELMHEFSQTYDGMFEVRMGLIDPVGTLRKKCTKKHLRGICDCPAQGNQYAVTRKPKNVVYGENYYQTLGGAGTVFSSKFVGSSVNGMDVDKCLNGEIDYVINMEDILSARSRSTPEPQPTFRKVALTSRDAHVAIMYSSYAFYLSEMIFQGAGQ
jgi:RHS repeat-associated protein